MYFNQYLASCRLLASDLQETSYIYTLHLLVKFLRLYFFSFKILKMQ